MRLQDRVGSNVTLLKGVITREREVSGDSPGLTNHLARTKDLSDFSQTLTVIEHHSVHELHTRLIACVNHFLNFFFVHRSGLLAEDMLAGFRCRYDPMLTNTGRQRHINRIDVISTEQLLVGTDRRDISALRNLDGTLVDEGLSFID